MIAQRFLTFFLGSMIGASGMASGDEAAGTPAKGPAVLRLLSYNIKHGRGMDGKVDIGRIAGVIAKSKADLVALQEVDKNCKRSGNRDIAAELGRLLGMEHRFAKFMDFQGGEYGLAVLSRHPVIHSVRHPLPEGAEPRCALEVSVRADKWSGPVSFVCIHNDWKDAAIRDQQVTELLKGLQDRKTPVILAGDFNGTRDDSSLKILEEKQWTIQKKTRGEAQTFPSGKPQTEIDFFVTRNLPAARIEHFVVEETVASDHRPIFATIPLGE